MSESLSDGLRATIEAAWDADVGGDGGEAATTTETAAAAEGRARDEAGRFARKEGEATTAPPADGQPPAPEDDYEDGIGFERDAWGRLPAEVRPTIKSLAQQRRDAQERLKGYEPLDAAFAPHRDAIRARFGSEAHAVQNLLHLVDWADRDFPGFVREQARLRRFDLGQLAQGQPGAGAPSQQQDPVEALLSLVDQRLTQRTTEVEINRLAQDFENDASLEHRANPAIRQVMAGLLSSGAAKDYRTAYDMAVHADPGIRAKLAATRAQQDQERAAQAVRERQSAAVSPSGAPGTTRPPSGDAASDTSIRGIASRAWDAQAGGRV